MQTEVTIRWANLKLFTGVTCSPTKPHKLYNAVDLCLKKGLYMELPYLQNDLEFVVPMHAYKCKT